MKPLNKIKETLQTSVLSMQESKNLKGKGVGNMKTKEGKKCPPPYERGVISNKFS